jgi:hypothetical protein
VHIRVFSIAEVLILLGKMVVAMKADQVLDAQTKDRRGEDGPDQLIQAEHWKLGGVDERSLFW